MVPMATPFRRRGMRAVVIAVVLVLMAACGGSDSSGQPSESDGPMPTGTPFKIGYICFCAGLGGAGPDNSTKPFMAWAKWTNAHGGLNGHPVEVVLRRDPGNPGVALQQVKALVAEGIVALVSNDSSNDEAWADYIQTTGIPVYNTVIGSPKLAFSPNSFSTTTSLVHNPIAIAIAAKRVGATKLAVFYCAEVAACKQLVPVLKKAVESVGLTNPVSASVLSTAPNYTAQCLAAKEAGADSLFIGGDAGTALRLVASCAQQGYKPHLVSAGQTYSKKFEGAPGTDGMIAFEPNVPFYETSFKGIKTMTDALDRYAKGVTSAPGYNDTAVVQWTTGLLISEAAVAGKVGLTKNPTAADMMEAMYTLGATDLGGMTPVLKFVKEQPHLNKCWFYAGIKNNKFATPYGLTAECAP